MFTLPGARRLRAAALVLSLLLTACAHAEPANALPDPHVTASTLQAAAVACASRGFSYVAHVDAQRWYCLFTNPDNEPEAVPVRSALSEP